MLCKMPINWELRIEQTECRNSWTAIKKWKYPHRWTFKEETAHWSSWSAARYSATTFAIPNLEVCDKIETFRMKATIIKKRTKLPNGELKSDRVIEQQEKYPFSHSYNLRASLDSRAAVAVLHNSPCSAMIALTSGTFCVTRSHRSASDCVNVKMKVINLTIKPDEDSDKHEDEDTPRWGRSARRQVKANKCKLNCQLLIVLH